MEWHPLRNALIAAICATLAVAVTLAARPAATTGHLQITYAAGAGSAVRTATLHCPATTPAERRACRVIRRAQQRGLLDERPETGTGTLRLAGDVGAGAIDVSIGAPDAYRFRALAPSLLPLLQMR